MFPPYAQPAARNLSERLEGFRCRVRFANRPYKWYGRRTAMFGWATHAVARAARRGDAVRRRPDAIVRHGPRNATCLRRAAPRRATHRVAPTFRAGSVRVMCGPRGPQVQVRAHHARFHVAHGHGGAVPCNDPMHVVAQHHLCITDITGRCRGGSRTAPTTCTPGCCDVRRWNAHGCARDM